jgi:predicted nucleotidyltransferase
MQSVMPVKFLNSSILKWPDAGAVRDAVILWAKSEVPKHPDLLRLGYFGSYARGDWGVGSDLDLIAIVSESAQPFERRSLSWSLVALPVPSDLVVYTEKEWDSLQERGGRFVRTLARETVWLWSEDGAD